MQWLCVPPSFSSASEPHSLLGRPGEFLARSPDSPDLDIDEDDDEKLYCYVGSHTTDHEYLDSDGASLEKECKYCEDAMEEE